MPYCLRKRQNVLPKLSRFDQLCVLAKGDQPADDSFFICKTVGEQQAPVRLLYEAFGTKFIYEAPPKLRLDIAFT